jgi:hypothetical protein
LIKPEIVLDNPENSIHQSFLNETKDQLLVLQKTMEDSKTSETGIVYKNSSPKSLSVDLDPSDLDSDKILKIIEELITKKEGQLLEELEIVKEQKK